MNTFDIVVPGRLVSAQDRTSSETTGAFLTNPALQRRLKMIHDVCRRHGVCGQGEVKRINGVCYVAVCASDYLLRLSVQFIVNLRHAGRQSDLDHLWSPIQNALAMPSPHLKVPNVGPGSVLYTLAANDTQICRASQRLIPYDAEASVEDITVIEVEALPPPHLLLSRTPRR